MAKKPVAVAETTGSKATAKATETMLARAEAAKSSGIMAPYYSGLLDNIDKGLRLRAGAEFTPDAISSGLLCVDWVLGGGVRSVFNQVSGLEQAAKTTLTISVLGGAVKAKVPLITYNDAEGSLTPAYSDAVLGGFGLQEVFDQVTRRYYSANVLEDFCKQIARLLYNMPDKIWSEETGSWCYFISKGHQKAAQLKAAIEAAGMRPDKAASTDAWWAYPTEYAGPEAAMFVDSWPALIPESIDDLIEQEKDSGAGLGKTARTMAEQLPTFAGRLKRKGVILWAVNQLRERPMSQGNPLYEPCGNALKLYTMLRNQMSVRAVPDGWDKDPETGMLCIEECAWGGGYDRYAFKSFANTKNKLGRPFLKTMTRVWTSDETGNPQGFDPVFDTWQFLKTTEQVSGGKNAGFVIQLKPSIKGPATQLNGLPLKWWQFKALILAEHFKDKTIYQPVADELGLKQVPRLRETLFKQLKDDPSLWGEQFASEVA